MFPIFQVGPVALQTPGIIILLGMWLGLSLSEKLSLRYHIDPNDLYNLVFIGLLTGVMGSRVLYVLQHFEIFLKSPLNLFSLNIGLLDPVGGLVVGGLSVFIYGNRRKFSFWATLDGLTPFLAVLAVFYSIAQFASGDAFGIRTNLPWGIYIWGDKRHPTQIYMTILSTLILGFIYWKRNVSIYKPSGTTFLKFTSLYAGSCLFIDAFRGDSNILISQIRINQIIAWIILALSLWGLRNLQYKKVKMDDK